MQIFKNSTCISWRSSIYLCTPLNLCGEKEVIKYAKTTLVDVLGRPKLREETRIKKEDTVLDQKGRRSENSEGAFGGKPSILLCNTRAISVLCSESQKKCFCFNKEQRVYM